MVQILDATTEIRSLLFAVASVANNTEGRSEEEVSLAVALLSQQISARCNLIDEACQATPSPAPARRLVAVSRKRKAA